MPSVFGVLNMPYRKRIPYGMMDFVSVREDDCYYVDKTHYIPLIEKPTSSSFSSARASSARASLSLCCTITRM